MKETFIKIGLEIYPIAWCKFYKDGVEIADEDDLEWPEYIGFFPEYEYIEKDIEISPLTCEEYKIHKKYDWGASCYAEEQIQELVQQYYIDNPWPERNTDAYWEWYDKKESVFKIWIEEYKEEWYKLKDITKLI